MLCFSTAFVSFHKVRSIALRYLRDKHVAYESKVSLCVCLGLQDNKMDDEHRFGTFL